MPVLGKQMVTVAVALCLTACAGLDAPSLITGSIGSGAADGMTAPAATPFDCVAARRDLTVIAESMAGLEATARKQVRELPTTAVATLQRLSDPRGPGLAAVAQYERDHARYTAQRAVAEKSTCSTADIDEKFKTAVASMQAFRAGR
jgi:hypothetical protein